MYIAGKEIPILEQPAISLRGQVSTYGRSWELTELCFLKRENEMYRHLTENIDSRLKLDLN